MVALETEENYMMKFNRREIIGHGLVAGTALSFSTTPGCTAKGGGGSNLMDKIKAYKTEEFYKDDGSFDEKAAKKAYYEMMEYYSYPIPDRLRTEDFWTLEFGLGEFLEVGMAGILWLNNKEHNYLGHEIFLLPGQMIPEHWHVETEEAEAKKEGWHVRHGWAYMYGEGEPTTGVDARIPPLHKECAEARAW